MGDLNAIYYSKDQREDLLRNLQSLEDEILEKSMLCIVLPNFVC